MKKTMHPKLAAARFITRILDKSVFVNDLLNNNLDHFPLHQRRFITELVYGTLRNLSYIDFWIEQAAKKPVKKIDHDLIGLIRVSVHQLLHMGNRQPPLVVNEAVSLTKVIHKKHAAGFVNYLLREIVRLNPSVDLLEHLCSDDTVKYITTRYSIPLWLHDTVHELDIDISPDELFAYFLQPQGITLRVEGDEKDRENVIRHLAEDNVFAEKTTVSPVGIYTERAVTYSMISEIPGVFIQDESSQMIVQLMDVRKNERVLDLCAAPGGKTLYLSHLVGEEGSVVASDINPLRLQVLAETLQKHKKKNVELKLQDGRNPREEWRESFHRVLVDAPCTSLGTVKRHPEVKWHRRQSDPKTQAQLTFDITKQAARYVRPGGTLMFSVCTFTPEETTQQLKRFKEALSEFEIVNAGFTIENPSDRRDLFYYILFRKQS